MLASLAPILGPTGCATDALEAALRLGSLVAGAQVSSALDIPSKGRRCTRLVASYNRPEPTLQG